MYKIPDSVVFIDLETLPGDATVGMDLTQAPGWEAPPLVVEEPKRRTVPASYKKDTAIQSWLLKEQGRKEEAADLYRAIADDISAPSGLRARATQMLAALGE